MRRPAADKTPAERMLPPVRTMPAEGINSPDTDRLKGHVRDYPARMVLAVHSKAHAYVPSRLGARFLIVRDAVQSARGAHSVKGLDLGPGGARARVQARTSTDG
jgi:hypothetical protein